MDRHWNTAKRSWSREIKLESLGPPKGTFVCRSRTARNNPEKKTVVFGKRGGAENGGGNISSSLTLAPFPSLRKNSVGGLPLKHFFLFQRLFLLFWGNWVMLLYPVSLLLPSYPTLRDSFLLILLLLSGTGGAQVREKEREREEERERERERRPSLALFFPFFSLLLSLSLLMAEGGGGRRRKIIGNRKKQEKYLSSLQTRANGEEKLFL